jgi:tetratricopeptide (TPR) repeat protein
LGPQHPDTATSLNNLAGLYRAQGKYAEAEPLYLRALEIREQQLGPQHPDTATSLHWLAFIAQEQQQYERAKPLYERALVIYEHVLGPKHPDTKALHHHYNSLLKAMGNDAETRKPEEGS